MHLKEKYYKAVKVAHLLSRQEKLKMYIDMAVNDTHSSNAIEGNTCTISDTRLILAGRMAEVLRNNDHKFEIADYIDARNLIVSYLTQENVPLSHDLIQNIHYNTLKSTKLQWAGVYRITDEHVAINGSPHVKLTDGLFVQSEMTTIVNNFNYKAECSNQFALLRDIINFKVDFILCHPFNDGNGRTSRLLLNFLLLKYGFTPIVINKTDRKRYLSSLDEVSKTNTTSNFEEFILDKIIGVTR